MVEYERYRENLLRTFQVDFLMRRVFIIRSTKKQALIARHCVIARDF
jgi:hypothetical protein